MSIAVPPTPAPKALPVWETAKDAYARVFHNPRLLFRASLVPYCLSLALMALGTALTAYPVFLGLFAPLTLLPLAIFGVAWHRLTLLGPEAGAPPLVSGWGRRQWRFLGYTVAVMVIIMVVSAALIFLGLAVIGRNTDNITRYLYVSTFVIAVIVAYLMIRMSFVFPAVSVDKDYRLRHAWNHTRGQGLRLLGATLIAAAPLYALYWGVSGGLRALLFVEPAVAPSQDVLTLGLPLPAQIAANPGAHMFSQAISAVIGYVDTALLVSAISIAFRTCTGWVPAVSTTPVPSGASD
jgi:hypothetical protein